MKKVLLVAALLAITSIVNLHAQCIVDSLKIEVKSIDSHANGCELTLDISFLGKFNNGNAFAFIHLWESAPVNNYPTLAYTKAPTAAELADAIGTIVIKDPGKSTASLHNTYPSDANVPVLYAGISFTKGSSVLIGTDVLATQFTMTNVKINISTCGEPVTVKGDVWGSQDNNGKNVHCYELENQLTILFNNPIINGIKQCALPRKLNLSFFNDHESIDASVVARVFIDVNQNNQLDNIGNPGGDIEITSLLNLPVPNPISLPAGDQENFVGMTYEPYSSQPGLESKPIIVEASATAVTPGATTTVITKTGINFLGECALLPVTLTSFTAKREGSTVKLAWQTAFEENNKGFAVERNINNSWTQVAFIASQAEAGNSTANLSYQFDDINESKSVSQYRLKQIDIDGKFTYSEVRSVAGVETQGKVVVYPNPSTTGRVNVVLSGTGIHDLVLSDMSGRVIKQWRGVSNNIQVENLVPGVYHMRIVDRETNKQTSEKIVISK